MPASARYHGGSCLCESYELRITERCLEEDLDLIPPVSFAEARQHPMVRAFEHQRSATPIGTRTVGPAVGQRTLYRLGHGHDHRGATWHDEQERVVWLCAYRLHRSGEPDDAFPYFHELIEAGRIMPTAFDYTSLFEDRGRRFAETVRQDAQALLVLARSNPGTEQVGLLGGEEAAGVLVDIVETLEETYVAFSVVRMDPTRPLIILRAFYPDVAFAEWEAVDRLPTRALRVNDGEIAYRVLRG
jgi:hypothetical protein